MPFGEAVDGGRGGNRYREGRLGKTDNFIPDLVHPGLEHVTLILQCYARAGAPLSGAGFPSLSSYLYGR